MYSVAFFSPQVISGFHCHLDENGLLLIRAVSKVPSLLCTTHIKNELILLKADHKVI